MATASFLAVPLKKTVEVDLSKPVAKYVSLYYKKNNKTDDAATDFNRLRNNAVVNEVERTEAALSVLMRYFDQLCALEGRLPLTPTQISVPFKWKDALFKDSLFGSSRTNITLTANSGAVERAAVLFNIGAMMSQIASRSPLATDEELKTTAKLFQQSAGVFAHLKDVVLSLVQQEATPDLIPETLHALSALMVAQAQESIYLKTFRDNMKPPLVAKIAVQTSDFYAEALKLMAADKVKEKVQWEKEWTANVNGKIAAYKALAEYHSSCDCKEKKEIGEELSRLEEARRLWQQAESYLNTAGVAKSFVEKNERILNAYQAAKKDNDFIYHEKIVDIKTLPAIGRTPLAKPLPVSSPMNPQFQDLFDFLERKDGSGGLLGKITKSIFG